MNKILAGIFLEKEFISDNVTIFLPVESALVENLKYEGFSDVLKNNLDDIFSRVEPPTITNFLVPSSIDVLKVETKRNELEKTEGGIFYNHNDNYEGDEKPVRIKIKKLEKVEKAEQSIGIGNKIKYTSKKRRCLMCNKPVSNMEVHLIVCSKVPVSDKYNKEKTIECPLCGKNVKRKVFEGIHYYRCSNWTVPGRKCQEKKRCMAPLPLATNVEWY